MFACGQAERRISSEPLELACEAPAAVEADEIGLDKASSMLSGFPELGAISASMSTAPRPLVPVLGHTRSRRRRTRRTPASGHAPAKPTRPSESSSTSTNTSSVPASIRSTSARERCEVHQPCR